MKRTVRLTEKDFARMVRRVVKESEFEMDLDMEEMDNVKGDINKVMDFAYEMITDYAPEGPRNKANYRRAIDQLEKDFNYALRNLRGNIGM